MLLCAVCIICTCGFQYAHVCACMFYCALMCSSVLLCVSVCPCVIFRRTVFCYEYLTSQARRIRNKYGYMDKLVKFTSFLARILDKIQKNVQFETSTRLNIEVLGVKFNLWLSWGVSIALIGYRAGYDGYHAD